jgi:hypothetical protein
MVNNFALGYQIELSGDLILLRKDGQTFKCIQANPNNATEKFTEWSEKLKAHVTKQKLSANGVK